MPNLSDGLDSKDEFACKDVPELPGSVGGRPVAAAHAAAVPCRIDFMSCKFLQLMKSVSEECGLSSGFPRGMGPVAMTADAPDGLDGPDELDESAGCTCTSA